MIITNLTGGLGNQLFQYVAGWSLAQQQNYEMKFDFTNALFCTPRNYKLDNFTISCQFATPVELQHLKAPQSKITRIFERSLKELHLNFNRVIIYEDQLKNKNDFWQIADNHYLIGYWQDFSYWLNNQDKIRKELSFAPSSYDERKNHWRQITQISSHPKVSLHFRRGDIARAGEALEFDYYKQASYLMEEKLGTLQYVIFSDDIEWVKNNFPLNNAFFVDFTSNEVEDLYLMSQCNHHIIANSTFSWWGAWFNQNDKIVIAPRKRFSALKLPAMIEI